MVEKFSQSCADILDKGDTGVESALYIFVPSLMSVRFGLAKVRSPWIQTPALHSAQYARNTAKETSVAFSLHQQAA